MLKKSYIIITSGGHIVLIPVRHTLDIFAVSNQP